MLEVTLLNMLPTAGPNKSKIAMTATATKTRIKPYSTRPWPASRPNTLFTPSHLKVMYATTVLTHSGQNHQLLLSYH